MMDQPKRAAGFTIVETLIFLTVTGLLLFMIMTAVSGQQRRTEFSVGIRDIESQLRDVMNDVATGFYDGNDTFSCATPGSSRPTLSRTTAERGTNAGCTYIGRVIQFAPVSGGSADPGTYVIYDIVGRQKMPTAEREDVTRLQDALPTAIAPTSLAEVAANHPDTSVTVRLPHGITFDKLCYSTSPCVNESTGLGIMTDFGGSSGGSAVSGNRNFSIVIVEETEPAVDKLQMASKIASTLDGTQPTNPAGGVVLCFKSGGTNQYGKFTIGGNNRADGLTLEVLGGSCG